MRDAPDRAVTITRTPRTLLCGLENDILEKKERRRAINLLIGKYPELEKVYQDRLEAFMIRSGTIGDRQKLGEVVRKVHGRQLIDKAP